MEFEKRVNTQGETSHKICTGLLFLSLVCVGALSLYTLISLNNYKDSPSLVRQQQDSSNDQYMEPEVEPVRNEDESHVTTNRTKRQTVLQSYYGYASTAHRGSVYTRWGSPSCPTGSSRIYFGEVVGSGWAKSGSTSYMCVPSGRMHWLRYDTSVTIQARLHGVDFQTSLYESTASTGLFPTRKNNGNVQCSYCQASLKATTIMIPGRTTCPHSSWSRQYYGYLMTTSYLLENQMETICVDYYSTVHALNDGNTHIGSHLVHVKSYCLAGSGDIFTCLPTEHNREMTCVVCSK